MSGYDAFHPGQVWLDTKGDRIQAHGGSVMQVDGTFYWYGENKERSTPGSGIWHYGIRCYRSRDLYNWEDCGLIIPPVEDDDSSPLHPARYVDRPHIIQSRSTGKYVCWLKIMEEDGRQRSTVLTADDILGPYTMVRTGLQPLGMNAGDFDLVIEPSDGKAYYYFGRVHSELICADLTADCTDVSGYYSTHLHRGSPPYAREAPAHFFRRGKHYLFTSGTSGYHPNPSEVAWAPSHHGPWSALGDPHPSDTSRSSYNSQITSVFKHPDKKDLYIALADRWMPGLPQAAGDDFASGQQVRRVLTAMAGQYDPEGWYGEPAAPDAPPAPTIGSDVITEADTSIADYVWLPVRFDGDLPYLDWHDTWRHEDWE
jgi:hypothetical protein